MYRTHDRIIADLLSVTETHGMEGARTTSLLSKANLPHPRLKRFLTNLTGAGLVRKIEHDGTHAYIITENGRKYLASYKAFAGLAESFGLEL